MGFTHYFDWKATKVTANEVAVIKLMAQRFQASTGHKLEFAVEQDAIIINGDSSKDHDHETLLVPTTKMEKNWDFCKTARKPYDLYVCAVLIYLAKKNRLTFSSDGDRNDWVGDSVGYEGKDPHNRLDRLAHIMDGFASKEDILTIVNKNLEE